MNHIKPVQLGALNWIALDRYSQDLHRNRSMETCGSRRSCVNAKLSSGSL